MKENWQTHRLCSSIDRISVEFSWTSLLVLFSKRHSSPGNGWMHIFHRGTTRLHRGSHGRFLRISQRRSYCWISGGNNLASTKASFTSSPIWRISLFSWNSLCRKGVLCVPEEQGKIGKEVLKFWKQVIFQTFIYSCRTKTFTPSKFLTCWNL